MLTAFQGDALQFDDVTLVAVRAGEDEAWKGGM
jgi:serine phosphatase RsbU (regulator of sigma subunit)